MVIASGLLNADEFRQLPWAFLFPIFLALGVLATLRRPVQKMLVGHLLVCGLPCLTPRQLKGFVASSQLPFILLS